MRNIYLWLINVMMFTFQDNISTPKVHEKLHENEARVSTEIMMMIASIQSYCPLSSRLTTLLSHGILSEWLAFFATAHFFIYLNIHQGGVLTALFGGFGEELKKLGGGETCVEHAVVGPCLRLLLLLLLFLWCVCVYTCFTYPIFVKMCKPINKFSSVLLNQSSRHVWTYWWVQKLNANIIHTFEFLVTKGILPVLQIIKIPK